MNRIGVLCVIAMGFTTTALASPITPKTRKQDTTFLLRGEVVDADTGKPLGCRLYLQGADGKWYFPASVGGKSVEYKREPSPKLVEMHTCLTAHPFQIALQPGQYTVTVEHGKEYVPTTIRFTHSATTSPKLRIPLQRWIDMPSRGWYSSDTHAHRPPDEMTTLQVADDVNVGFPLTFWVTKAGLAPAQGDKNMPVSVTPKPVYTDPTHVYWPLNTEYELFSVNDKPHTLGAVFALNHKAPIQHGIPPTTAAAQEVHAQGGLLELDKHAWEWTMAIIPTMKVDLYDLTNNHMWRTGWGVAGWGIPSADYMHIERDAEGWTEAGWIDYGFQNYYALLDCGFNLRPTGGTGTGYHPVPFGWGRVYAHITGKFSYEKWLKALNDGDSFVTNGPLLTTTVEGKPMGHKFGAATPKAYLVEGEAASLSPIGRIEIVVNGSVVQSVKPENRKSPKGGYVSRIHITVPITGSSWLLVRCYENRPDKRVRFAHTAPVHISIPGMPLRPRKEEVAFLIKRVQDEIARSEGVLSAEAIAEYRQALKAYQTVALTAK